MVMKMGNKFNGTSTETSCKAFRFRRGPVSSAIACARSETWNLGTGQV